MCKPIVDIPGTIHAEGISLGTDMYKTKLNNNVIVFGTPGGGKTEGVVKPNIMQMNSSYVVTDPKGNLYKQMSPMLKAAGYNVCCLDFTNPEASMTYNPFTYVNSEEDIDYLAKSIVFAEGRKSHDPFWDDAAELLLKAIMHFALEWNEHYKRREQTSFHDVITIADWYSYSPNGEWKGVSNLLEEAMEEIRRGLYWNKKGECKAGYKNPDSIACKTWNRFRTVTKAETTTACIIMEMWGTLNHLAGKNKERLFSNEDPVDLASLGKKKTALFVIVSDTDRSLDFMVSVFYGQLFKELCRVADQECAENNNRLLVPVRLILDDFANQAPISNFETYIAALRSRDIWLMPICQAVSQLEQRYGAAAETIIGCCDTAIYLGVNDMRTARELSERSNIPIEDIQQLPIGEALIFTRGQAPQSAHKYDLANHPNYKYLNRKSNSLPEKPQKTSEPLSENTKYPQDEQSR